MSLTRREKEIMGKPKISIGQVWNVFSEDVEDTVWRFEIIAKAKWRNKTYWIARKLGVQPDAFQIRFFDIWGEEIDDQGFGLQFYLEGLEGE